MSGLGAAGTEDPVVPVPAPLDHDERLVGPVTFRMVGWLALAAAGVSLIARGTGHGWVGVASGGLLAAAGLVGALWRPGGRPVLAWTTPLAGYRGRRIPPPPAGPQPATVPAGRRGVALLLAGVAGAGVAALLAVLVPSPVPSPDGGRHPGRPAAPTPVPPAVAPQPAPQPAPQLPLLPAEDLGGGCGC